MDPRRTGATEKPRRDARTDVAADYAAAVLASLGRPEATWPAARPRHPAIEWARSGAMALTGPAEGAPRLAPGPLAACARGALLALRGLAGEDARLHLDAPALLGERAAISGSTRRGSVSPGGSCRLIRAADGWIAVNLARPEDVRALPAWLGEGDVREPWRFVVERVAEWTAHDVVERARLLGLPAAVAMEPAPAAPPWFRIAACGPTRARRADATPLVVDLASLWAGPLCTHLLGLAGARVIKVESTRRPDGARSGPPAFFDLLNAGKESVALDVSRPDGRAQLRRLVERADIVVESARPRALAQLGIDAASLVGRVPGLTWVSITGYGREEPGANWVAFGDDAAIAAGLAAVAAPADDAPLFCGDAIADPLTGLHAAVAARAAFQDGGAKLLDLSLRDVVAHVLAFGGPQPAAAVRETRDGWEVVAGGERAPVDPPRARAVTAAARPLGADTDRVLGERTGCC
ncbi:MAG: CoA transferase [Deltaproteobacteria bacterium]|nr:MAG: CoA transferase [Deltaproteobacteria bacterium]